MITQTRYDGPPVWYMTRANGARVGSGPIVSFTFIYEPTVGEFWVGGLLREDGLFDKYAGPFATLEAATAALLLMC